jgi:hypothetical protein
VTEICHIPLWIFRYEIPRFPWKDYGRRADGLAVDRRTLKKKSTKATRLGRQWLLYLPMTIAERFRFVHIQPKTRELDAERRPVE